ncbi:probable disease resistance protein At4g33300 [Andrographis paniculata]|uniref:probable disease resistance protein At4g33300 n=1 Tax=Andrographis paniculata TaxID=175694 RepID=UPI0021E84010|nr:probable disease resistance protein At4g33300 [Andrographis paniculata]
MAVTDLFAGEIAAELLKHLITIARKSTSCRSSAEQLIHYIRDLLPIIQEIKLSGTELPQHRQRQLDNFSEILSGGLELANKVLNSPRWNVYRNICLARRMEKLERNVSRFMKGPIQAHVLADVHHVRVGMDERLDRLEWKLGSMKIGVEEGGGWLGAAVKRVEDEERWCEDNLVNLGFTGLELGKMKVKEMLMADKKGLNLNTFSVVGIHGIGGIGKTTLAREICKDHEIRSHFNDKVHFLTISQSPNVEQLRSKIRGMVSGNTTVGDRFPQIKLGFEDVESSSPQSLLVLDDVWTLSVLEQLLIKIPGLKILVVSRIKFPPSVVENSYELDLLTENEALSLFCHFAFGQTSIPIGADEALIKEVVDECKRLPLALKVIGASLKGQSEMFWTSAKNRLSRSQPLCESHEVQLLERMKLSIDNLSDKEKECFLDLGAFPEDKRIPLDILINMWVELRDIDEQEAFAVLVQLSDKNLLTLVKDARAGDKFSSYYEISVYQHDVLRDLAIHLSNAGGVNQRKRLLMPRREAALPKDWERHADEPFNAQVISIHTGEMSEMEWLQMNCPKTEVLVLNFSSNTYFLPPFIKTMPKLRALILINYSNTNAFLKNASVFSSLTNLRSLWFEKIALPLLPHTTTPLENLQKVSLVLCDISKSIHHSHADLPHLFPRLAELTLDHCINLSELPSSICLIQTLTSLSVTNCDSLEELPENLGRLGSLQILRLSACPNLKKLPPGVGNLGRLKYIDVSQCVNLGSLPEGIGGCARLEKIDMRECPQMKRVPGSALGLASLRRVICDEEVSWLWKDVEKSRPGLCQVARECFTLDWLDE